MSLFISEILLYVYLYVYAVIFSLLTDLMLTANSDQGYLSERPYELATHTVKVRRSGALIDVKALWDLKDTDAFSSMTGQDLEKEKLRYSRFASIDSFNKVSAAILLPW